MAKSWTTKSSQVLINIFTTLYSELRNNKKIYMKLLKFKLLMLSFLLTSTLLAEDLSSLQQKKLVSGLNYLQYSTAKIKLSENKAIAEDVYYSIINELKLEGISNRDLNFEYSEFLAKCANLKLVQNEKDFIKQLNEKQQNSACLSAFSNFGSVFVPGQTPHQMVASLVYTSVASAFAIINTKNQLQTQLEKDMFYLNQQVMQDIYDTQRTLFTTSAKLLSDYGSDGRINENSMNIFMNSIRLASAKERKNSLCEPQLQANMSMFPPYWYELGRAYQELGDFENAMLSYNKFEELKQNDIVAKDNNYVNLIKNKIQILLGSNPNEVTVKALSNKEEILRDLEILKLNYLDSDAGEKNAYLAKIYFLIGCTNESLQCLNYIISSKSTYPELIEEAIALKLLIQATAQIPEANLYQCAYNFSKVRFGNSDIDYSKLPTKKGWLVRFWESIVNFFSKLFSSSSNESNNNLIEIDPDFICFQIPNNLIENYDVTFTIDDVLYVPSFYKQDKSEFSIGFIEYEYDDIEENCIITMCSKSKQDQSDIIVKYQMSPVKSKIIKAAQKAYQRIGSDIISHNPLTVVEFGETILDYDYEVDDVEDLREDIRDDKEEEGEENNWPKEEINSKITEELSAKLIPDMKYLQDRMKAVEKNHYSNVNNVYSPALVTYDDDYYLVGIVSINDSKIGKEYTINTDANIKYKSENKQSASKGNIADLTRAAYAGDINSMVTLGIAYIEGYNIAKNPSEGMRWLFSAINTNDAIKNKSKMSIAQAYKYIGECYWEGLGVHKDKDIARKYFRKSKDYGFDIDEDYL